MSQFVESIQKTLQLLLSDEQRRRRLKFILFGTVASAGVGLCCYAGSRRGRGPPAPVSVPAKTLAPRKSGPNKQFVKQLVQLLRTMVPGPLSKEAAILYGHSGANPRHCKGLGLPPGVLVARAFLSIYVARMDGQIVKSIVQKDVPAFLKLLAKWLFIAVPATFINSMIKYFESVLGLAFRNRLAKRAYAMYFQRQTYYRVSNMDGRLTNADQCLTEDIGSFCDAVASLYSDLTKPLLDIVLITSTLVAGAATRGANGTHLVPVPDLVWDCPLAYLGGLIVLVMMGTGRTLKALSPRFGQITAECAKRRGKLRFVHSRIIAHSEEIAFYGGNETELTHIASAWAALRQQMHKLYKARIGYIMLEQFLMKYIWSALGMVLVAVPILTANFQSSGHDLGGDGGVSERTKGFTTAKALLMNGADAIERLMSSYKKVAELSGYTSRVSEMFHVFEEVADEHYVRPQLEQHENIVRKDKVDVQNMKGVSVVTNDLDKISLDQVPIVTPTGDVVVSSLSLKIDRRVQLLITGPNGCGKSSLFRVLAGLWPVAGGTLHRPPAHTMFYVPQKPYMTLGTLLDQVIYPETTADMLRRGVTERRIGEILRQVHLEHIVTREGGWHSVRDWADVLSGGEKQRVGLARVFYHRPPFAMLDECTSAISVDVEASIYKALQDLGVTLLTVSHRPSLWRWHTHVLLFDGEGGWRLEQLTQEQLQAQGSLSEEKAQLERRLAAVPGMQARLAALCAALGDDVVVRAAGGDDGQDV